MKKDAKVQKTNSINTELTTSVHKEEERLGHLKPAEEEEQEEEAEECERQSGGGASE